MEFGSDLSIGNALHIVRVADLQWRRKGRREIHDMTVIPVVRSPRDGIEEDRA